MADHVGADWRATTRVFDWTKLPKTDPRLASGDAHPVKNGSAAAEGVAPDAKPKAAGTEPQPPGYIERVGTQGGLSALMFAVMPVVSSTPSRFCVLKPESVKVTE